jgi:hypothetical protein
MGAVFVEAVGGEAQTRSDPEASSFCKRAERLLGAVFVEAVGGEARSDPEVS